MNHIFIITTSNLDIFLFKYGNLFTADRKKKITKIINKQKWQICIAITCRLRNCWQEVSQSNHELRCLKTEFRISLDYIHPIFPGANSFSVLRHKVQRRFVKLVRVVQMCQNKVFCYVFYREGLRLCERWIPHSSFSESTAYLSAATNKLATSFLPFPFSNKSQSPT